jgi:hypothetical protein
MEDTDACIAIDGKIAMLFTLPAIDSALEPISPAMPLAMLVRNIKDSDTSVPCSEAGKPMPSSCFTRSLCILKLFHLKSNTKLDRRKKITDTIKLIACAVMVAIAAPAAPIFSGGATSTMSSTTLIIAAISTKISGWRESPIPRSTALTPL